MPSDPIAGGLRAAAIAAGILAGFIPLTAYTAGSLAYRPAVLLGFGLATGTLVIINDSIQEVRHHAR